MNQLRRMRVVALPGDGIGPEVTSAALAVLKAAAKRFSLEYTCEELPFGGRAVDLEGSPFPEPTRRACLAADAVLMGAVGGPRWETLPAERRPERGLFAIRKDLGAYANLRPIRLPAALSRLSPLRPEIAGEGIDIVFVRELTGGLYFGAKRRFPPAAGETADAAAAEDVMRYTAGEVRRVAEVAFKLAASRSKNLVSVDKENVLACSRLWRETVSAMAPAWPQVHLSHLYVDNCAMQLVRDPRRFDVILTENTFGDILSDLGGAIAGSLGLLPSASLGGRTGLYEPVHGSAPDIAGQGIANPVGSILSVAMMLRHSFGHEEAARAVEQAVDRVLVSGSLPADLAGLGGTPRAAGGGSPRRVASTAEFGELVAHAVGVPAAGAAASDAGRSG